MLLTGIAWCGRCGHKMYARYKTRPEYVCNHLSAHQGLPACQYISVDRPRLLTVMGEKLGLRLCRLLEAFLDYADDARVHLLASGAHQWSG